MNPEKLEVQPGKSFPLGATIFPDGVNFAIFAKHSTGAELLLFNNIEDSAPSQIISLNQSDNKSYYYWHVFVPGIKKGQIYAWRIDGPFDTSRGLRFDASKVLLDPYGKCVAYPSTRSRNAAAAVGDNCDKSIKNIVIETKSYDWENDKYPRNPFHRTIIYEMHVGGFTKNPNSGVPPEKRGTYAGVIEKIPYLQDLGITAVELLPVFAFDEQDAPEGLKNSWGYEPLAFFAPHPEYSSRKEPMGALDEFRDMVKALHKANIEVILDVVFNHTAEGAEHGPTISFRGLSNNVYYILGKDKATYSDFTGCGNTLNANESIVRRLILDSLRYWVEEMHVDGFRFDLASILSRDEQGNPMATPPILWDIESDPVLSNIKLIAEAWDAAGLYQVGSFPGDVWKEWNGHFRDDVRSFVKGDTNTVRSLAYRMTGSPDIYQSEDREPEQSINFITCHDGFTLNDLVSYNQKHNEANKEENRDGSNNNLSWNSGTEGPTDDPEIEKIRNQQIKNFLTILFFSVGTPMILAGDEVRRTQRGNNNTYCQTGEISWFDWSLLEKHADIYRLTKQLINFRLNRNLLCNNNNRLLSKLASVSEEQGAYGAQYQWPGGRGIDYPKDNPERASSWAAASQKSKGIDMGDALSTGATKQIAAEIEFQKKSNQTLQEFLHEKQIQWHGVKLHKPDFSSNSHSLAASIRNVENRMMLHIMANAYWEPLTFEIPPLNQSHERWHRCIDTSLESPHDILPWRKAPKLYTDTYKVEARSVVILVSSIRKQSAVDS